MLNPSGASDLIKLTFGYQVLKKKKMRMSSYISNPLNPICHAEIT
jgi:hypothetical protein